MSSNGTPNPAALERLAGGEIVGVESFGSIEGTSWHGAILPVEGGSGATRL